MKKLLALTARSQFAAGMDRMKARTILSGVLAVILWLAVPGLYAQQPQIDITLANSLVIPHLFDHVIKLPNGDLQFYKMTISYGSIEVNGFQYILDSNTLTAVTPIGSITGIQGDFWHQFTAQRFGKFYSIYQYPDGTNPQGIVILRMDAGALEYRIIDDLTLGNSFYGRHRIDIVAENSIVLAVADSLVYYDFASDISRTLLDGAAYETNMDQSERVYAMPDGHFMYVKDSTGGYNGSPETWMIYDVDGNYQFTETMNDPYFGASIIGLSWGSDYLLINDRIYINLDGLVYDEKKLECHFPSPDSLHYYVIDTPYPLLQAASRFIPFGENRILRSYFDFEYGISLLFMNYSPLEFNPAATHMNNFGLLTPHFNCIGDDIVTISAREANAITISALCTLNFPNTFNFSFEAPPVNIYLHSISFSHENNLMFLNDGRIFVFSIDYTVSNADETQTPPLHTLSAYPNPVNLRDHITFKAPITQAMELDIYNIRGQKVATLMLDSDGSTQWNLRNDKGEALSTGVYIAKIRNHKGIKPVRFVAIH
ncbi:MAG: T9SS type A sorting domain-containing protein [Candidatus Cloacimonadaceae bacterium]|nr:T9SS type A sorting domain-containing protein [Candidatus Cloacimonadaceae bacterium]